jgi:hypothetical protein
MGLREEGSRVDHVSDRCRIGFPRVDFLIAGTVPPFPRTIRELDFDNLESTKP